VSNLQEPINVIYMIITAFSKNESKSKHTLFGEHAELYNF
jgi:hypothetical protein